MGSHSEFHGTVTCYAYGIGVLVHYEHTTASLVGERCPAGLLVVTHLHGLGPVGELLSYGR